MAFREALPPSVAQPFSRPPISPHRVSLHPKPFIVGMLITSPSCLVLMMGRRSESIGTLSQLDAECCTSRQQQLELIAPLRMKPGGGR